MVEYEPQELAREFHDDSAHIKAHRDHSLTLEELESTRQVYLDDHPEIRDFQFEASVTANKAPTSGEVDRGTYLHDRFNSSEAAQ